MRWECTHPSKGHLGSLAETSFIKCGQSCAKFSSLRGMFYIVLFISSMQLIASASNLHQQQQQQQQRFGQDYQRVYLLQDVGEKLPEEIKNEQRISAGFTMEPNGADFNDNNLNDNYRNISDTYANSWNNYDFLELLQQAKRAGGRMSAFVPMRGRRTTTNAPLSDKSGIILRALQQQQLLPALPSVSLISSPRLFGLRNSNNILDYRSGSNSFMEPAKLRRAFHPMRGKRLSPAAMSANKQPQGGIIIPSDYEQG